MGPLVKLASIVSPGLGSIYKDSLEFGQSLPRHNDNGPGDAARHAYAMARTSREYGPTAAKVLGALYEMTTLGQDRRAEAMDDFNNRVGLSMANVPEEDLRDEILGALNEGRLKTLPKGINEAGYAEGGLVSPLGHIYSSVDVVKRRVKDLFHNPLGYIQQLADATADKLRTVEGATEFGLNTIGGPLGTTKLTPRAKLLADIFGKDHPAYSEILNARYPEEVIRRLPQELAKPKFISDNLARRWESKGRPLYDKGVVHYDVSGGTTIPDVIRNQEIYALDEELPTGFDSESLIKSIYEKGRLRISNLKEISPESAVYVPYDPWVTSPTPLNGKHMFYINEVEGAPSFSRVPSSVDIRSILNEPELRRELNLSLATPEEGILHKNSKGYARGGLVQYCNCGK